ncbi:MAG: hypothetical protein IRY85_09250 [Micromonosporaceae bacterium]|nr:hypothetical protein [Micromonosporaceae bacterium]
MSYTEEQLRSLLGQAYGMPYGPGQNALLEQVIAHADAAHLTQLAFTARMQATVSYVYSGEPVRSFATFAWCLAEFDRTPTAYQHYYRSLLWHFKYMVSALTKFPEVPLARTYEVLDDMQRRWTETGHSLHAVYAYRHRVAAHIGDIEAAEAYYAQWCAAPRDDLSDCNGCDPTSKAYWLRRRGRYEEAVALADTVLSGQLTCFEQPQGILTALLVPYLRTGRLDQARDAHRRAYRVHRSRLADMDDVAQHIEFCARTGNEARALEMVERHLGWLDRAPSPWAAMRFAAVASMALRRAQERQPDDELTLHRPAHGDRVAATVTAAALAAELANQATEAAERFDRRNGTDHVGTTVREILDGEPWIDYLPLSPTAARMRSRTASGATWPAVAPESAPSGGPAPDQTPTPTKAPDPSVAVPETSDPDQLLDIIEEHHEVYRMDQATAALEAFATRYGDRELTARQRARLAEARAAQLRDDVEGAAHLFREAAREYASVGDPEGEHRALARAAAAICWDGDRDDELPTLIEQTEWLLAHGSPKERVAAASRLAIVHHHARRSDQALAVLDRVADSLDAASPPGRARHAAVRLAVLAVLGRVDEILQTGPAAVALAESLGLAAESAQAHAALAAALRLIGNVTQAADHLAAAAHHADGEHRTGFRLARAELLAYTDRAGEVIDELVERVADSTARGDRPGASYARFSLAVAYLNANRLLDAAEVAEEELAYRLRHLEETEKAGGAAEVRELLVAIYERLGQPTEAIEQLDAIAEELGEDRGVVAQVAQRAGEILAAADQDDEAARRFLTAADIWAELNEPLAEVTNRRRAALSLHWAGRSDEAVAALARADAVATTLPADDEAVQWARARLDYDGAHVLWGAKRSTEAAQRAARAAEAVLALGSPGAAAESHLLQAQILLTSGQPGEAEAAARRALDLLPEDADREVYLEVLDAARSASGDVDSPEPSR